MKIKAIYENGVLRPLEKLDLEEKENVEVIPTLEKCENAIEKIPQFGVKVLSVTVEAVFQSRELRRQYLLMTNDSLNLYVRYEE